MKTYLGYDLGDGESITDIASLSSYLLNQSVQPLFVSMTMPDCSTPGQAIPTAYATDESGSIVFASSILSDPTGVSGIRSSFKRRPSDLLGRLTPLRRSELLAAFSEGWPDTERFPEAGRSELLSFAEAVTAFTDGIFKNPAYMERVRSAAHDSEEIVFCVGHPTRWDGLDIAVYRAILSGSVLGAGSYAGKKSSIYMGAESRAAFLYVKSTATSSSLPRGRSALLIDVGSSTIDVTAMTADAGSSQYNSGSNYLGARAVDLLIREYYLGILARDPDDWAAFNLMLANSPNIDMALTLSCRAAKEKVFSIASGADRIYFADFPAVKITRQLVNELIDTKPVGELLDKYIGLPADVREAMGDRTWAQLFRQQLEDVRAELEARDIRVGRIIMTGSASRMPVVPEIVRSVFSSVDEDELLMDMNPSRSISMGLALGGCSHDKTRLFRRALDDFIANDMPGCITGRLPELADSVSDIVDKIVQGIVRERFTQWRSGKIRTLRSMTEAIKHDCSVEVLNARLNESEEYRLAIRSWAADILGADVAVQLQRICRSFGLFDISPDFLNVFKVDIGDTNFRFSPGEDVMESIGTVLSVFAGIVAAIVLPFVMGVVISVVSWISAALAFTLLDLLLLIPGPGYIILITIAGYVVFSLVRDGAEEARDTIVEKLQDADLPDFARRLITDSKLGRKLGEADIRGKVRDSMLEPEAVEKLVRSISENLTVQILKRAEPLMFEIESR